VANNLYEENRQLRNRLKAYLSQARRNEEKMARFNELELKMIGTSSIPDLVQIVIHQYPLAFELDSVTLTLLDPEYEITRMLADYGIDEQKLPELLIETESRRLSQIFHAGLTPVLGGFIAKEHGHLFGSTGRTPIQSIALLPLVRQGRIIGSMNIGSAKQERFIKGSGTDFLQRLAAVVAVCLENTVNHERLKQVGLTDPLTRVNNRRFFDQRLSEEVATSIRHQQPLSCMFLDIDHFKRINDSLGHQAGDLILREVAMLINSQLRTSDILSRYGGEEFVALLPNTDEESAGEIAARIRSVIAGQNFQVIDSKTAQITISIGVNTLSNYPPDDISATSAALLAAADQAVYRAKETGRNRVVMAGELQSGSI
jgi:two-component system cell cycle response regulator